MNSISLSYKDVFEDYDSVNIKQLLADIPSKNVLQVVGHFSAQIHTGERDKERQIKLLKMWIGRLPVTYVGRMQEMITYVESRPDAKFNFINNISNCMLAEYALENFNQLPIVNGLTPQQELNLIKAYLFCTQQWLDKQDFAGEDGTTPDGLAKMLIKLKFPYDEILQLKDFRIQFVKAVFFLKFCENNPVFNEFVKIFCKEHNVASWNEYLANLLGVYIRKFDEQKTPSILKVEDEHKIIQDFLRQFSIEPKGFMRTDDFLNLREKPVFEIEPNTFLFLNLNFLVDKFFQAIQFALAKALIKSKTTYKGKEIRRFDQFKSIYGEELSEKGMFYSIMNYLFEKSTYTRIDGQTLKQIIGDGESDYYLRSGKKVLLIEYKDVLINAPTKHSHNYKVIQDEIFKKLVSNQTSTDKGITQLVNSIEKFQMGEYKIADTLIESDSQVYPILIATDHTFNIPGVNFILNQEFRRILKERGINDSNIFDLVIIHLDELLRLQDFFRSGKLDLGKCVEEYCYMTSHPANLSEAVAEFSEYMRFKMRNEENFTPEMLLREVKGMLRE